MMRRPAHTVLIAFMLLSGGLIHAANAFDIDGDGETDALTDGLLVLRYFFGFSGSTLIEGAVATGATRSTATDIESYIESIELYLDIDQDGSTGALTDGLLLLRYLFGFSGETLVEGALGGSATQTLPDEIAAYIQSGGIDTDDDGVGDAIDAFPTDPAEWTDTDGDGIGNNADGDDDGDGTADSTDAFPLDSSEDTDSDSDGVGDNGDAFPLDNRYTEDSDNDLLPNVYEDANGLNPSDPGDANSDVDEDGLTALEEFGHGTSPTDKDSDFDTLPDGWELDQNRNPLLADYAVAAGRYHTCALDDSGGGVTCWGYNGNGETDVPSLDNPWSISTTVYHVCAIDNTGVVCWGLNGLAPVIDPPDLTNPKQISAGEYYSCALDDSGVVCWGSKDELLEVPDGLMDLRQISAGYQHTCALGKEGVSCWGANDYGQLDVPALSNPRLVDVGETHTCSLDDTGVVCWGNNADGQLDVPALANPLQVSLGLYHSCALDDTGVVCWGGNYSGQTDVPLLSNPKQVSAAAWHTCALDDFGVHCWGHNGNGKSDVPMILLDSDGDGVTSQLGLDEFPFNASESTDTDEDGVGNNADTDDDGDGALDTNDAFPLDATESLDSDSDGVGDNADALPDDASEQVDTDSDGVGNNADTDDDGDGTSDSADAFPLDSSETTDTDGDGIGNNTDSDDDNDGYSDSQDAFPLDASENRDTDNDGIGNNADTDDDGDGTSDSADAFPLDEGETTDTDGDGIGNNTDSDDDGDGYGDTQDAFPLDSSENRDTDGDGLGDNVDEYPTTASANLYLDPNNRPGNYRAIVAEMEDVAHRSIVYSGLPALQMLWDLDDLLNLDDSYDWVLVVGSTVAESYACAENGYYTLTATRTGAHTAEGTIEASNCGYMSLTVNGTVNFTADAEIWAQSDNRSEHPVVFQFNNLRVQPLNRSAYVYGGTLSCDNRVYFPTTQLSSLFDHSTRAYVRTTEYFSYTTEIPEGYDLYADYLRYENGVPASVTAVNALNCDYDNVTVNHSGNTHTIDGEKVLSPNISGGEYLISSNDRDDRIDAVNSGPVTRASQFLDGFIHSERGNYAFWAGDVTSNSWRSDLRTVEIDGTDYDELLYTVQMNTLLPNIWDPSLDGAYDLIEYDDTYIPAYTGIGQSGGCLWWTETDRSSGKTFYATELNDLDGDGISPTAFVDGVFPGCRATGETLSGDTDGDGVSDAQDAFPFDANETVDTDGDGTGNNADTDDDNDGVLDVTDAFPLDATETADSDGDGIGDNADADSFTAGVFEPWTNFHQTCANPRTGSDPYTGEAYVDAQGTYVDENNFLRSFSNDIYLWYDQIDDVDPRSISDVRSYFDLMKTFETTASGAYRDKSHSAIDTDLWNQLNQTGSAGVGYGARFELLSGAPPRELVVSYTEPNSPATAADVNLSRGTRILEIDGVDVESGSDVDTLNAGINPSAEGETHEFTVRDLGETLSRTVTMSATEITVDPVQHVSVISSNSGPVGYLLFNTHNMPAAEKELVDAITYLAAEEVTDLVLDLRYNRGGYGLIANQLAYMIAGPAAAQGKVFGEIQFNDKHTVYNPITDEILSPDLFQSETVGFSMDAGQALPSLNLSRVYVLTSSETCSASELVMNGLRGIDIEVIQVGGTTCGKPYGYYPEENCGTTYFTIELKVVNAKGFGEYTDGFSPSNTPGSIETPIPGCAVADDFDHGFADPDEARLSAALGYRLNGLCPSPTAISPPLLKGGPKKTVEGELREPSDRHRFPGLILVPLEAIGR